MNPLLKRLWRHITSKRRKQLGLLLLLMLFVSIAEVISIGAVVPFLGVLANPEMIFNHELIQPLIVQAGFTSPVQLLLPLTAIFGIAVLLAGMMRIVLIWAQIRLAQAVGADLSYQIYRRTLFQSYSIHVVRNSSEVIAGVSVKANQVVGNVVHPVLMVLSSVLMLVIILGTLITLEPILTITIMIGFALIYGFFIGLTNARLRRNSQQISRQTNQVLKLLQEGLGGIRDVLIDGTQSIYCKTFRIADLSLRRAKGNNQIMGQTPRFGVEALGMLLIASVAYTLRTGEDGLIGVLPMLGALAIGAQRMLPMLQQAYASWSSIRGAHSILMDALELLEQPLPKYAEGPTTESMPFQNKITINQLGFRYLGDAPWVLRGVALEINKGSRIGFIGTTGSGKSTLLDIIMGLLHPTEGTLKIDGVEVTDKNHRGWQSHVAHIPQTIFLSDATIAENIAFGIPQDQIDMQRVKLAAHQAQIAETVETWKNQYQTMVGERGVRLSGGQRQRIGIARALYKQSAVLILDEATSALDNATEKMVMDAIYTNYHNITIMMVAHRLSTLKGCDTIVELENGSIKRLSTPKEITARFSESFSPNEKRGVSC